MSPRTPRRATQTERGHLGTDGKMKIVATR